MRGFQLWINLPSNEKMKPAAYRDIPTTQIPTVPLAGGGEIRVIAGEFEAEGARHSGPIGGLSTAPQYFDLRLPAGAAVRVPTPQTHNTFLYVYEGDAAVGDDARSLPFRSAGLLTPGQYVDVKAGAQGAKLLLLSGKPIGEPVVQYGPFVMNTREEIEQAVIDYQRGRLAVPA
jgi:redox-sensitive bicupin YhaK (pirin superfamily)